MCTPGLVLPSASKTALCAVSWAIRTAGIAALGHGHLRFTSSCSGWLPCFSILDAETLSMLNFDPGAPAPSCCRRALRRDPAWVPPQRCSQELFRLSATWWPGFAKKPRSGSPWMLPPGRGLSRSCPPPAAACSSARCSARKTFEAGKVSGSATNDRPRDNHHAEPDRRDEQCGSVSGWVVSAQRMNTKNASTTQHLMRCRPASGTSTPRAGAGDASGTPGSSPG